MLEVTQNQLTKKIETRKTLQCQYLTELLFVNFRTLSSLCIEKQICTIALEYSESTLYEYIIEQRRLSMSTTNYIQQSTLIISFLKQMLEALICLKAVGITHGFIEPNNILVYNINQVNPSFKLLDISFVSPYKELIY